MSRGPTPARRARRASAAVSLVVVVLAATVVGPALLGSRSAGRPHALPLLAAGTSRRGSYVPVLQRHRPLFVLVLGSDARPGEPVARLRADSIHLIGVDVGGRRATVLGFPRDAWVEIPGYGRTKINNGMVLGGPELMVGTVERLTGIPIDFWVLTSFQGLVRMVDAVGPLEVEVDRPMFDRFSGTNFSPGRHRFSGREALAFARDRHSPTGGDLGRSLNQGKLLIAALRKLRADFRRHPALLFSWLAAGWRNVQTDLSPRTLLELALTAASIPPARVSKPRGPGHGGDRRRRERGVPLPRRGLHLPGPPGGRGGGVGPSAGGTPRLTLRWIGPHGRHRPSRPGLSPRHLCAHQPSMTGRPRGPRALATAGAQDERASR